MATRIITRDKLKNARRVGELLLVYILDESTFIKAGSVVRMAEAKAMQFVREKTTIHVLEAYNAYTDSATGHGYIVTEYVKGDILRDV
jgi:hypothetical protein